MYRLVYYSRNRIAGAPGDVAQTVQGILRASQRNNFEVGVTGALLFNAGIFAQVLEGRQDSISATFERIQRDPRHGDVHVLGFEQTSAPSFPNWSMAYLGRSREAENLFGSIAADSGFRPDSLESERIFRIMREIALEEESAAA
nr:BLUF domain-containing protein [Aurantimonas sp. CSK15Z-1]